LVRNIQVARDIAGHEPRTIQTGIGGRAAITRIASVAIARHGGDDAVGVHLADDVGPFVTNIQVAGGIANYAERLIKDGVGGRAAVAGIAAGSIARHGGDDAVGVHLADALVAPVSNIQVAEGIKGHAGRQMKAGLGGRAAIPE